MITKTNQRTLQSDSFKYKRKTYQITNLNIQCFSGFDAQIKFIENQKWVLLHGHDLNYAKELEE